MDRLQNLMGQASIKVMNKTRNTILFRVIQRTLIMMFPIVLIGSFCQLINLMIFDSRGFFGSIFHLGNWVPFYEQLRQAFVNLSQLTLGFVAVIAAFGAAKYTVKIFHKDDQMAGITGIICYLMISYQYSTNGELRFNTHLLGMRGLMLGLVIGLVIGYIFKWTGKNERPQHYAYTSQVRTRTIDSILPMLLSILAAIILSGVISLTLLSSIPGAIQVFFQQHVQQDHSFASTIGLALLTTVLSILGLSGPYAPTLTNYSPSTIVNMNYALSHHSAWHVPYRFTETTLYQSFGTFGGVGATLALILAIFIVSRNHNYQIVSSWSLIPSLFNINHTMMVGIPLLYNPIFMIPFIFIPVINSCIASLAILLKFMPPVVYPVPNGTPGPLIALIGTNGNIIAFFVGIVILIIDVMVYLPFVRLADSITAEEVHSS